MADPPEGSDAIPWDLDRLESWAERNLVSSTRAGVRSCIWGGTTPSASTGQGLILQSSSVEKDLGLLVDHKVSMSWQGPCGQEGQWCPGVHQEKHGQNTEGVVPLLGPAEATPGDVFSSGLFSTRETRSYWRGPIRGPQRQFGVWKTSLVRRDWRNWACLLLRRLRGDINISKANTKRMVPDSFQRCPLIEQDATALN